MPRAPKPNRKDRRFCCAFMTISSPRKPGDYLSALAPAWATWESCSWPILLRFHSRAVVQNELPTPVAPHEDVRKSERHLAGLTFVRPFQVLHFSTPVTTAVSQ